MGSKGKEVVDVQASGTLTLAHIAVSSIHGSLWVCCAPLCLISIVTTKG